MKVVLLQDVENVGKAGDIVNVKDGYGRNFIIKLKKGLPGTKENIERAEAEQAAKAQAKKEEKAAAEALTKELAATELVITERAGADGQLYGSVTSKDIAAALIAQKNVEIDKRKITVVEPIRNVGRFVVRVKTYTGVEGDLTVIVKGGK